MFVIPWSCIDLNLNIIMCILEPTLILVSKIAWLSFHQLPKNYRQKPTNIIIIKSVVVVVGCAY